MNAFAEDDWALEQPQETRQVLAEERRRLYQQPAYVAYLVDQRTASAGAEGTDGKFEAS
jgi:hypothetical protein